ncbi:hypothetical protein M5689_023679 [Euphorbia peplus]|nr:hypothetical protein M5689_023679 [Euphorbia peplus]
MEYDYEDASYSNGFSVLTPKQKDEAKQEPAESSPAKPMSLPGSSKSADGKRKLNADDSKSSSDALTKKVKEQNV